MVTYENLQHFFNSTYDRDNNNYASIAEFSNYFNFMEPDHNITEETIKNVF